MAQVGFVEVLDTLVKMAVCDGRRSVAKLWTEDQPADQIIREGILVLTPELRIWP